MEKGGASMGYPHNDPAPPYTPMPSAGFAPPPQPYPAYSPATPGMVPPPTVSVVQTYSLRSQSTRMTCPHCRAEVSTRVRYETGRMTHIAALLLCLIGCWPCACIPYCINDCMDADHECPNCNTFIGSYRR